MSELQVEYSTRFFLSHQSLANLKQENRPETVLKRFRAFGHQTFSSPEALFHAANQGDAVEPSVSDGALSHYSGRDCESGQGNLPPVCRLKMDHNSTCVVLVMRGLGSGDGIAALHVSLAHPDDINTVDLS